MNIGKIGTIAFRVLVVLATIYAVIYLIWIKGDGIEGSDKSLILTYILGGAALLATVAAAVAGIFHSPKSSIKFAIGLVGLGIIGLIGYSMSEGTILDRYEDWGLTSSTHSKLVDAGLYLLYGVIGISLTGIIVSEVMSYLKN